jgi:hypothetical protein
MALAREMAPFRYTRIWKASVALAALMVQRAEAGVG